MRKVFDSLNRKDLYQRCVMASIAHAIMVGKYYLLSSEQSWDGLNYNFQNMEGVRGVISFDASGYVCIVQNIENYIKTETKIVSTLLKDADIKICNLAINEALLYLLIDDDNCNVPAASIAFWGDDKNSYSNMGEKELFYKSDNTLLPYLYNEDDAKEYWVNNYEMNSEQAALLEEIYKLKVCSDSKLVLDKGKKEKLEKWFGKIDECLESFSEINIFFE